LKDFSTRLFSFWLAWKVTTRRAVIGISSRSWVAARPLGLLAQLEVAETGKLDHLAALEGNADLLEERLDHVLGLALVQTDLLEHQVGELGLGESDFVFHVRGWALNSWRS
jgi:hypothetical protein